MQRVANGALVNDLYYSYFTGTSPNTYVTNNPQSVDDEATPAANFPSGQGTFTYDVNGNRNSLTNTGTNVTPYTMQFNLLNLPQYSPELNTEYIYDASGQKLRHIVGGNTTDYISGIQYDNESISFIQTDEGRAIPTSPTYNFEYNLGDHLGNTRITFDTGSGYANTV